MAVAVPLQAAQPRLGQPSSSAARWALSEPVSQRPPAMAGEGRTAHGQAVPSIWLGSRDGVAAAREAALQQVATASAALPLERRSCAGRRRSS